MNRKTVWLGVLLVLGTVSCGGEGNGLAGMRNGPITDPDDSGEDPVALNSIELLASSPQMQSDGSTAVTLSALPKNANNQVVEGVPVVFSADSGTLVVTQGETNDQGVAMAELNTGGDPTNRVITVTAMAANGTTGTLNDSVDISVIGSSMQLQGPTSLVLGDTEPATYTATLADAAGTGIANRPVEITSANGNGLSATTLTTDVNGKITVELTPSVSGSDTLTASALPGANGNPTVSASFNINVSADNFRFLTPTVAAEVPLGTLEDVTVRWLDESGNPMDAENISFATTRGDIGPSATTDGDGEATVQVSSTTAGPATITATNSDKTTAQLSVEFVATDPDQLIMQTDPGVIGPNETSTITAIVEDPVGNRVKNAEVTFTLTDTTGGGLSVPSAITDSLGRAQTVYTASSATSAEDGVVVTGRVVGTALQTDASLTVGGRALSMVFGTGNSIIENEEDTTYTKDYTLIVSDASGAGVANTKVNLSIISTGYYKGELVPGLTHYGFPAAATYCVTEDNGNGTLDAGEDINGDGELTPGKVGVVSPGTITTDESGLANFQIVYPQDHAMWVEATITASATVAGTESRRSANFYFPAAADDLVIAGSPPNFRSPWGVSTSCTDTL